MGDAVLSELQIDLGGFVALSQDSMLILISILLVRGMFPRRVSEPQHRHCSCPGECPPGAPRVEATAWFPLTV